jgi:hypothetical protein
MSRFSWKSVLGAALFAAASIQPASAGTIVLSNLNGGSFDGSSGTRNVAVTGLEAGYGTGIILDVDIAITFSKIAHQDNPFSPDSAFFSEIEFKLTGPAATTTTLIRENSWNNVAGSFGGTITFDDAAAEVVNSQSKPVAGTFRPVAPETLAQFNGQVALGSWSLFIRDTFPEDPLVFSSYTLTIRTADAPVADPGADPGVVPEPASLLLFGTGLASLVAARRRATSRQRAEGV